jgi:DNA-directed RNA polymerase subunit N
MIPVRCFTCGKPIRKWESFEAAVTLGEKPGLVLDMLGILRICCRRMYISHIEVPEF